LIASKHGVVQVDRPE